MAAAPNLQNKRGYTCPYETPSLAQTHRTGHQRRTLLQLYYDASTSRHTALCSSSNPDSSSACSPVLSTRSSASRQL